MSYCNDRNRVLQPESELYKVEVTASASSSVAGQKNRKSNKVQRKFWFCFKFAAFVFSHVGLGFMVLLYTVMGAFLFKHFEEWNVSQTTAKVAKIRNSTVNKLWAETYNLNVLYKENWTAIATKEIEHFQRVLMKAFKDGYSPEEEGRFCSRWSFTDSWMYSISLITTIGYANRPSTAEGKIATILYALVGIPIMLLFLSTVGNLLSQGLKSTYHFCCACFQQPHSPLLNLQQSDEHNHTHPHQQTTINHHQTRPTSSQQRQMVSLQHQHHHHLVHQDYQVHHIGLSTFSNCGGHLVSLDQQRVNNNQATATGGNRTYTIQYPYESDEVVQAENKPSSNTVDHLYTDKVPNNYCTHVHNCDCREDMITPMATIYSEDPCRKVNFSTSVCEEGHCESVPFYFCILLIILYMLSGAFLFSSWEGWSILEGAYFCFVTLSTIGFGDIIPDKSLSSNQTESKKRIILIVLYIIGGMTLIAMSFNIVYQQLLFKFRTKFHRSATEFGQTGNGRDIKIVSNKFLNTTDDIDV